MKKFLILIIIIPICFNIELADLDINSKLDSLLNILKTTIPDFITNIREQLSDFGEMAYETQQKLLKSLNNTVKDIIGEIKEGKDNINKNIKEFIEKVTEIAGLLTYRDCGIFDYIPFYECRNSKKYIFTPILETIKEEFQCSKIIDMITTNLISKDLVYNLKSVLFFVYSITNNPDSIIKGSTQILYDTANCLQEKFDVYWPKIEDFLNIKKVSKEIKKDALYIIIYSLSNLVNVIRQEESDGFLSEINGIISDDMAKKLQKSIFAFTKRFNEFGTNFYNITGSLTFNVTINPGGLGLSTDTEVFVSNINNKGIKIILHSNYLLRLKGAYSIQTIVFESPLVSLRAKREEEDGVAKVFVGITLYDKDGNEILVSDLNLEDFRPQILYKKNLYNAMKTCLFYNEEDQILEKEWVLTDNNYILDGEKYIRCIPKHLSIFTIGVSEIYFYNYKKIIIISIICLIVSMCLIIIYIYFRKKTNNKLSNIDIEKKQNNKKNYIGLEEEEGN